MLNRPICIVLAGAALLSGQPRPPQRAVTDPGVVTTRQAITPAGVSSIFDGRVYGVSWSADGDALWVLGATELMGLDWRRNEVKKRVPLGGAPGLAGLRTHPQTGEPVYGSTSRGAGGGPRLATVANGTVKVLAEGLGRFQVGGVGVSGQAPLAIAPLIYENKAVVVDARSGERKAMLTTGIAPWAAVLNGAGTIAYVANLGGRPPRPEELFASPVQKPEEKITVDARGIASTGTVQRFEVSTGKVTHTVPVGLHPASLAWDEPGQLLYVANGNTDSISVIHTGSQRVVATIPVQIYQERAKGIAPTALALSADGSRLYVACGGINAVAVIDTRTRQRTGLIPTGWYPNAIAISPDGKRLAVSSLLGAGSGWRGEPNKRFVHSYRGSVSVVEIPDAGQLANYTTAVAENNRVHMSGGRKPGPNARPKAIPERSGEPSLIEHVVYIIKENRTYDQVLGDLPQGNGDPSMVMFGRQVTPNHHKLAEEFVVLDNTYATGGNSADGHQWLTQSNEVEYALWPGYQGRSYPFDGTDPMAYSEGGFLWDYALARGKTVRVYGEYAGRLSQPVEERFRLLEEWKSGGDFSNRWKTRAPIDRLNGLLAANYPAYSNAVPDVVRAQIFKKDLERFEREGKFPNLVLLQLPCDHTFGARAEASSPSSMVADNDLALGQIIEALSASKFWPKMAIFVIQDDAQNGVDHVDGHRMPAFVVSPYARRKHVDSTFYATQSVNKTIELILGLPTMSLFDLIATDMRESFTDTPDLTPYRAAAATYDLFEKNPPVRALRGAARAAAVASGKMNFDVPDAAPTEKLNRILWGMTRGWGTPYPGARNAVFSPLAVDIDDEDREERPTGGK